MSVSMITPNDSVAWIHLFSVYCMKRMCISFIKCIGWQDAPLVLEDLAEEICIIVFHAPCWFQTQFHDNKRVANGPLRVIEHGLLDWEFVVVTTLPLVFVSLLFLLCYSYYSYSN